MQDERTEGLRVHPSGILGSKDYAISETTGTVIKIMNGKMPMMTKFAVYNLARNNQFDYSKAERELGYHTRPYEETLRDEARWLMEEGYIEYADRRKMTDAIICDGGVAASGVSAMTR